jgi:hypothetical protein
LHMDMGVAGIMEEAVDIMDMEAEDMVISD